MGILAEILKDCARRRKKRALCVAILAFLVGLIVGKKCRRRGCCGPGEGHCHPHGHGHHRCHGHGHGHGHEHGGCKEGPGDEG